VHVQVHPILIKVTLDKQEPEQLRASAFMVLKKSHPSFMTLQVIAHSLRSEPSRQIKTLIYSGLVNMATFKSHIPEIIATYVYTPISHSITTCMNYYVQ